MAILPLLEQLLMDVEEQGLTMEIVKISLVLIPVWILSMLC